MPRDVSLSDSKCWNSGHEWVKGTGESKGIHLEGEGLFQAAVPAGGTGDESRVGDEGGVPHDVAVFHWLWFALTNRRDFFILTCTTSVLHNFHIIFLHTTLHHILIVHL